MPNGQDLTTQRFRQIGIPILAAIEAIASKGRSPGTAALGAEQSFQQREALERQERERQEQARIRALQGRVTEARLGEIERGRETEAQEAQEKQALMKRVQSIPDLTEIEKVFAELDPKSFLRYKLAPPEDPMKKQMADAIALMQMQLLSKKVQEAQMPKLTGAEKTAVGAVGGAVQDLNKIVTMYKGGETGTAEATLKAAGAKIPFIGQRLFPSASEFNKFKRQTAERFLRQATGAAAPAHEVKTYSGFLPEWGDTPRQAQAALDSFKSSVRAKAMSAVSRLKAEGQDEAALGIQNNIDRMLSEVGNIIEQAPAGTVESPLPAPAGGDPRINRLKELAAQGDEAAQRYLNQKGIPF